MIQEAYCGFEVAKLLKENGFDEYCYMHYEKDGSQYISDCEVNNSQFDKEPGNCISAPTHQMAMRWLREEKGIFLEIFCYARNDYAFSIEKFIEGTIDGCPLADEDASYNTYEEAVEEALKYTLESLI